MVEKIHREKKDYQKDNFKKKKQIIDKKYKDINSKLHIYMDYYSKIKCY